MNKEQAIIKLILNVKWRYFMKAFIERNGCIGCGLCSDTCPEVFRMDAEGLAEVFTSPIPSDSEASAKEAEESCPVSVILIEA
jgi:ferredoxin